MLAFLLTLFIPGVLTLLSSTRAVIVNITVDDASSDPLTGFSITYLPLDKWNNGPTCNTCRARADKEEMYNGTWHDSTYFSSNSLHLPSEGSLNATFVFNGTFLPDIRNVYKPHSYIGSAIYIFCAIALSNNIPDNGGYTNMTFHIDHEVVGHFEKIPGPPASGDETYQYDVLVYSNASMIAGEHKFVLQNGQEGGGGNESLTLFDYLVYSYEDGVEPTVSTSTPTLSTSSPMFPTSLSSGARAGIAKGMLICIIILLVAVSQATPMFSLAEFVTYGAARLIVLARLERRIEVQQVVVR
ncbi:hypothetical protein BDQ17DRAFT_1434321 [Cyathus striatus]|nr:hypothetical protein BDQ17DRAFT_1434321 [Cyathus striatus]